MPEAIRLVRLPSLLNQLKDISFPFETSNIGKVDIFQRNSVELLSELQNNGLNIPPDCLNAFGINSDPKKKWIIAQEQNKRGYIAMQFNKSQDQVSFDTASAIMGVEYDQDGQQVSRLICLELEKIIRFSMPNIP